MPRPSALIKALEAHIPEVVGKKLHIHLSLV
jgi:hypothetical protein